MMKLGQDHNCLLGHVLEFRFQSEDNEENWEVMKSNFCFRKISLAAVLCIDWGNVKEEAI